MKGTVSGFDRTVLQNLCKVSVLIVLFILTV
jgi:hypothetical protein